MGMSQRFTVALDPAEADFLATGLLQWGGVVAMGDDLAKALGFHTAHHFMAESMEMSRRISDGLGLTADEWRRCLATCEIAFSSEVLGLGHEWTDFSSFDDEESYEAMRRLQWKLANVGVGRA